MRLVLFTYHYPFGHDEQFLENEMRIAEQYFDSITIVTMEKACREIVLDVPHHAKIVSVRRQLSVFKRILESGICLFRPRVWRELIHAKRTTEFPATGILKGILIRENVLTYIRRYEREWIEQGTDTVYYSYWLGEEFVINNSRLKGLRISRAHGGDCFYARGYHPYRRQALRNLDYVFPISEAGRRDIIEHYADEVPGLAEKVKTARLGIAIPNTLNPYPQQEERTIVSCSNIIRLKRLDLLIDALSEITNVRIRWIHFGDGELRGEMEQYAQQRLGGKENIRYEFRGYLPNSELMAFYQRTAVDLFVNCSDVEGIPVSVMEAMAHGIPAIGRSVGGMEELLDAGCGILLPEQTNARELSAAIQRILSLPPEAYLALRANARGKIVKDYDADRNYRVLFEFIKERLSCRDRA